MSRKFAKIVRIFVEIEHIESRVVTFWPERIRLVFPTLWSSHDIGHQFMTNVMTTL